MERVFWLLLGKDGASVKNMMEEFQQSHRHSLPDNHRKLVPIINYICILYSGMLISYLSSETNPPSNTLVPL